MSLVALPDFDNFPMLARFLKDVCQLSCQIWNPAKKPVFIAGDPAVLPDLTPDLAERLSQTKDIISIENGIASGLFQREDPIGYILVHASLEFEKHSAIFFIELVNDCISRYLWQEEHSFDVEFLKNTINQFQKMSRRLSTVFDPKIAGNLFLTECRKFLGVRSGAIFLKQGDNVNQIAIVGDIFFNDKVTFAEVCQSNKAFVCQDVHSHARLSKVIRGRNAIVMPLLRGDEVLGAICLCDKELGDISVEDQRLAQTLSALFGNVIGNIQLHKDLISHERVRSNLERYLSPNIVQEIIKSGEFQRLGGQLISAVVFFSDIRGFTKISEIYTPEQMVIQLNEYFEEMTKIIFMFDGTLDKFVGDMVMVLFGVPRPIPNSAERSVRMAIKMQQELKKLNTRWVAEGKKPFGVGMGINLGDVIFGNIGSTRAMGLTVIGDNVNQAQRLEAYAKAGEILITESIYLAIQGTGLNCSPLGVIEMKGKRINAFSVQY